MTKQLKRGSYQANYPIAKLKFAIDNRDFREVHSINFKAKLVDYGWLVPIIISKTGDVIEGHHRIQSAILLKQKTIPAYIVDWIDTSKAQEHLNCIISLNNGNLNWNMLDYLKSFANHYVDYNTVYNIYKANSNNITVGNIIHLFFTPNNKNYKKGSAKVADLEFSNYLLNKISNLNEMYGYKKIVAYCVREFIAVAWNKANKDIKAIDFLFNKYEKMVKSNHPSASSIPLFRPTLELYLNEYNMLKKKK